MRLFFELLLLSSVLSSHAWGSSDFLPMDPGQKWEAEEKWNRTSYSETEISLIRPFTAYPTTIPLQLIVLKGSSWAPEIVLEEFRKMERIFGECKVSFSPVTLIEARSSLQLDDLREEYDFYGGLLLFPHEAIASKPALLFQERATAYSWPAYYMDARRTLHLPISPLLENTGVIPYFSYSLNKNTPDVDPTFSVSAHELAHILLNRDHNLIKGDILCGLRNCKGSQVDCKALRDNLKNIR